MLFFSVTLVALVGAVGCSEVTAPQRRNPGPQGFPRGTIEPGDQWPARIRSAEASYTSITAGGFTSLKASMNFDGSSSSISGTSTIRESSGSVIQLSHSPWEGSANGWNAHLWAEWQVIVQSKCGALVSGDVAFQAIVEFPSLEVQAYVLDHESTSRSPSAFQQPCAPCPLGTQSTGSAGADGSDACTEEKDEPQEPGGGGGGCLECVEQPVAPTYCRVRYWYWKDTGEIFDYTILWCA
jgi:hypothetical protein